MVWEHVSDGFCDHVMLDSCLFCQNQNIQSGQLQHGLMFSNTEFKSKYRAAA